MNLNFAPIDELFQKYIQEENSPGIAYGITHLGELVHASGYGVTKLDGPTPHASSIFRIASMTKSFTAAAILLLRDEGFLSLDEPITTYLPEMAAMELPTSDSPPLTLRLLLTMSGGLPTDDPWADRQEGMSPEEFGQLISRGFSFIHVPGTRFEYSNLGYTLAGRVISRITGIYFTDFVRQRFLEPLGMMNTGFSESDVDAALLTRGHRRREGVWLAEEFSKAGEFSALGGLFSTVADLAIWVGAMVSAFDPHQNAPHPLSRASRREMQQGYRNISPTARLPFADELIEGETLGYGLGLVNESETRFGTTISHSGGYPGYGTHMRWHLASGYGLIALSNSTYAPSSRIAKQAHRVWLRQINAPSHLIEPWPKTLRAQQSVRALLEKWDHTAADALFANNVDQDEPRGLRAQAVTKSIASIGGLTFGQPTHTKTPSASQLSWNEPGANGHLRIEIQLTPENPPLIQTFNVTAVIAPTGWLAEIEEHSRNLASALAALVDAPLSPGDLTKGDGNTTIVRELRGRRGLWIHTLKVDPNEERVLENKVEAAPVNESEFIA